MEGTAGLVGSVDLGSRDFGILYFSKVLVAELGLVWA